MPASHVAIYNDLRGPSNSVTVREASSNLSIAEAATTIGRGSADAMIAGATGTRVHCVRTIHVCMQEEVAPGSDTPESDSRPFDRDRRGLVVGEGAGTIVVESIEHASARNAKLYGEILGYGSSCVMDTSGRPNYERAVDNVIGQALAVAELKPDDIGHVHAHGLGTRACDIAEARAISRWFGRKTPVTTLKSYTGNLGAGGGLVELIASLLALREQHLFPILNLDNPDPACEIHAIREACNPGKSVLNLNVTPQGQASALVVQAL
jgi:3-oxoacyl-[acyl-carrier-protein] synthase II